MKDEKMGRLHDGVQQVMARLSISYQSVWISLIVAARMVILGVSRRKQENSIKKQVDKKKTST